MREIKFRIINPLFKKEYIIQYLTLQDIAEDNEDGVLDNDLEPIIHQYTGLKDKTGKEIYEGDLVRYSTNWEYKVPDESQNHVVIFKDGMFGIKAYKTEAIHKLTSWASFEVVGNIYEHPELIEVNDEVNGS